MFYFLLWQLIIKSLLYSFLLFLTFFTNLRDDVLVRLVPVRGCYVQQKATSILTFVFVGIVLVIAVYESLPALVRAQQYVSNRMQAGCIKLLTPHQSGGIDM